MRISHHAGAPRVDRRDHRLWLRTWRRRSRRCYTIWVHGGCFPRGVAVRYLCAVAATATLVCVLPGSALGGEWLSRAAAHHAADAWVREQANEYMVPFRASLEPARSCRRLSTSRVSCRYAIWLGEAEAHESGLKTAEWCPAVVELTRQAGRIHRRWHWQHDPPCQSWLPQPLPGWAHPA
jgi:hypothetical protein